VREKTISATAVVVEPRASVTVQRTLAKSSSPLARPVLVNLLVADAGETMTRPGADQL
jgi:hypothetical protein